MPRITLLATSLVGVLSINAAQVQAQPGPYWMPPPPPVPFGYPVPPRAYVQPYYPPAAYWPPPQRVYPAQRPGIATTPTAAISSATDSSDREATTAAPAPVESDAPRSMTGTAAPNETRSTSERQQNFIDRLLPIVQRENARLVQRRLRTQYLIGRAEIGQLSEQERAELRQLTRRYRVEGNPLAEASARDELLQRVDVIPVSLALAQAANESAWGTSRFAREGNNLFGIWTYDASKGMLPKRRAAGKSHLVRRFDSLDESVRYYLHTLNSHPAYQALRQARAEARARGDRPLGMELAAGLTGYSAKGDDYVSLIRQLIQRYDLAAIAAQGHTG